MPSTPKWLVLDNGTELKSNVIREFSALRKIDVHYITLLNSNSNSAIERFHSTNIEYLRIIQETRKELSILDQVPYAILGYNNSVHTATKQRPIDIINGHLDANNPFEIDVSEKLYINYISQYKEYTTENYIKI